MALPGEVLRDVAASRLSQKGQLLRATKHPLQLPPKVLRVAREQAGGPVLDDLVVDVPKRLPVGQEPQAGRPVAHRFQQHEAQALRLGREQQQVCTPVPPGRIRLKAVEPNAVPQTQRGGLTLQARSQFSLANYIEPPLVMA